MAQCKCPESEVKPVECPPYFESITSKMEERHCDLMVRQKYLRDKVSTMERSMPALIAYNMWMSKDKCSDAPSCKVRDIMKKFSRQPDPTEKLLKSLKETVKELNGQTAELHEKIIQADVKLEETDIELESLELLNKEMNEKLTGLEKEMNNYATPSLHSIHSEDLICLSKIHQLAKEELCLKHCIKQLEQKETLFREHMERILTSKEYQNICDKRKIVSCLQSVDCTGRMICYEPKKCLLRKPAVCRSKKKLVHEDVEIVKESENTQTQNDVIVSTSEHNVSNELEEKVKMRSSWIPNWWSGNKKNQVDAPIPKSDEVITISGSKNNVIDKTIIPESSIKLNNFEKKPNGKKLVSNKLPQKSGHTTPCKPCGQEVCPLPSATESGSKNGKNRLCAGKLHKPYNTFCIKGFKGFSSSMMSRKPFCDIPYRLTDHGIQKTCKLYIPTCNLSSPGEICPSMSYKNCFQPLNNCRCNYKGKCARGLSGVECNCSDALDLLESYQPLASQLHPEDLNAEDNNTDDEFCECCSCGCEDTDEFSACQCN
nr:uncharacterized protein LOC116431571 [Nomia melanderi]